MPYANDDVVMDESFSDNRLLRMFPDTLAEALRSEASFVTLEAGDVLFSRGQNIK